MRFISRPVILITILAALSILTYTSPVQATDPTYLGIWSRDYQSSHIVDPLLGPGSLFTIELNATNIPQVVNQTDGGATAFDVRVNYDPTILLAQSANFKSPDCPSQEGCIFDFQPPDLEAFLLHRSINNDNGTVRLAVVSFSGAVDGSGSLFRIGFEVVGAGYTAIDVVETYSVLIGPDSGGTTPVDPIPYQDIDGSFDNRPPFALTIDPAFAAVGLEQSVSSDVEVFFVRKDSFTDTVSLTANGQPLDTTVTFSPQTGVVNFTSRMTVTTSVSTPRGTHNITITGTGGEFTSTTNFTLAVGVKDIAVLDVNASPTFVTVGEPVTITATITNQGSTAESFAVLALVDFYLPCPMTIGTQTVQLASGETATVFFVWNTAGITCRTVSTYVAVSVDDVDTTDNSRYGPTVTLNQPPVAAFSITPGSPFVGQPAQFDASQSTDPDGEIATYIWFFGDGYTDTVKAPTHIYNATGTYDVTLEVTDGDGDVSTTTRQVTVASATNPQPPGPQSPTAPLQLPRVILYSAAGALGAVVVAVLLVLRRARKQPE